RLEAAVPLGRTTKSPKPQNAANSASNAATSSPEINDPLATTRSNAARNPAAKDALQRRKSFSGTRMLARTLCTMASRGPHRSKGFGHFGRRQTAHATLAAPDASP